ncbi:hypothetical protein [Vacuolonema iberomarrocanum]|uniref:hypothetical protein n=1 Tax=Vacuolonema iberomarrocanum TaxID=3454632 RepID=UPI001A01DE5C|nr:hypothetical protein [filamentous cyanobacterium LEGE 07170]
MSGQFANVQANRTTAPSSRLLWGDRQSTADLSLLKMRQQLGGKWGSFPAPL